MRTNKEYWNESQIVTPLEFVHDLIYYGSRIQYVSYDRRNDSWIVKVVISSHKADSMYHVYSIGEI